MRFAYSPVVSSRNISAAPSYQWFLAFRRYVLLEDPNAVFYVLIPRMDAGDAWQEGADWSGPRTHLIPVQMAVSQFDDLSLVTREVYDRFNERFGDLHFDVWITEKPMIAPILKNLLSFKIRQKSRHPLVVNRDQFVVDVDWFKVTATEELLEAAGWCCAPTVFQSDHQAKRAVAIARKHVTPAHLKRMTEMMRTWPLGIDCADVDRINSDERGEKYDDITINYSHKLFLEQRFLQSLKIMDNVLAGGRAVRLQIVTGSSAAKLSMIRDARKYRYISTYGGMNRPAFLKQVARAHLFISNSIYEDFSATVVEQIWTGLLPVLLRAPWSEYLVGKEYPYLFRTPEEGGAMIRYVVDNYEAVRDEWVPRLREQVLARFDLAAIVPEMLEWMQLLHRERIEGLRAITGPIRQLVRAAVDVLPAEFGIPDFAAAVRKVGNGVDIDRDVETHSTSRMLVVDAMLAEHPDLIDLGTERPTWRKP